MTIQVKNIVKEYLSGDEKVLALDSVDFSITSGQFVAITGRSGSGKSTLMNIMAGLTNPTSGMVTLNGKDIFAMSDIELSLYRNETVGCLPQVSSVLPNPFNLLLLLVFSLTISIAIAPLSAAYSAFKISRAETYATMREGE